MIQHGLIRLRLITKIMMISAALLAVSACAVKQTDAITVGGTEYGVTEGAFRGKWHNFYKRGASYIEGALAARDAGDEATMRKAAELGIADIQKALQDDDKDRRRALTYGVAHLIDYFPHRELGIAYFLLGKIDDAKSELEKSLATVESAKAQFFLDKVRKKIIDREGGDASAPSIMVSSLPKRTRDAVITIEVNASDDGYISSLSITKLTEAEPEAEPEEVSEDGEEETEASGDAESEVIPIPLAVKSVKTERKVALAEGKNEIEIIAGDLSGNTASKKLTVISDTMGPNVSIDESKMLPGSPARMRIKGWVVDPAGVKAIKFGESKIVLRPDGGFNVEVRAADGKASFETLDALGNKTTGEVNPGSESIEEGSLLGSSLAGFINRRNVIGPLVSRWVVEAAQAAKPRGPIIKVKGLTSKQTVYFRSFYLQGVAYDPSGITKLVVGRKSLMQKPARKIYFNYLRRLHRGRNRITIVGRNGLKKSSQKRITVYRRTPVVRRMSKRMRVSMLPFHLKGQVNYANVAYDNLLKYLKRTYRFRLIDRTQINRIVQEQRLSKAGLTNKVRAVKVGRLAAAVYARLVDVQTSRTLTEKDAYTRQKPINLKKLMRLMRGLSIRVRNQFPLVQGRIASLRGRNILAKMKSRARLKTGTKFIIFRDKIVYHPQTKVPLGNKTVPVTEARISRVVGTSANAVLIRASDSRKIRKSDKVITK